MGNNDDVKEPYLVHIKKVYSFTSTIKAEVEEKDVIINGTSIPNAMKELENSFREGFCKRILTERRDRMVVKYYYPNEKNHLIATIQDEM